MASTEDSLLQTLIKEDDITWQSMIFELVKTAQMDPWDIDLSVLSEKFLTMVTSMKETNLKVSGKVILASSILLRLKSGQFIDIDLANLERLMTSDDLGDDFVDPSQPISYRDPETGKRYQIFPRTPQPRQRKVSMYDLVAALEKLIEVQKKRMTARIPATPISVNLKHFDINVVMKEVFNNLQAYNAQGRGTLKFSEIVPSTRKEDVIATFIPLLHLTNQRVTDLFQENQFEDFDVVLLKKGIAFEDLGKINSE